MKNYIKYGVLYNWLAAQTVCPKDWHLPSDEEWKVLESYLGMEKTQLNNRYFRPQGNLGLNLKSKEGWNEKGNGIDKYGFSVLPGGYRSQGDINNKKKSGGYVSLGKDGYFWSSTKYKEEKGAYRRHFGMLSKGIDRFPAMQLLGYCVRCIKN